MGKVSRSLERAIQSDRAKHPDRTGYTALRRGTFSFMNGLQKNGTKAYEYVSSDYANEIVEGEPRYITDVKDAVRYGVRTLKEKGLSDDDIKKLF